MPLGPFDLHGGPFLILYVALLIAAIVASRLLPALRRPEGEYHDPSSPADIAYLAGGRRRYFEAVVVALLSAGKLVMSGKQFSAIPDARPANPAEATILAAPKPLKWNMIERRLSAHAWATRTRLATAGLLLTDDELLRERLWQTAPFLLLIGFGAIKWTVGIVRDRPVGYLTCLLIVTLILAIHRWRSADERTRNGRTSLERARDRLDRLRRAPTRVENDMAVALFGTVVLVGSDMSDFHARRVSSGDGGGCGGGGSGDGGGGGGCGGCGGGD